MEAAPGSIVVRQSTEAFGRVSFPVSLHALFALGNMVHYFFTTLYQAVLCPVFGRCMWGTELGFPGDARFFGEAMLGSTVDTCSASVLGAFGRILHIFYGEVDADPRSHAEWRSVLSRCFSSGKLLKRRGEGNYGRGPGFLFFFCERRVFY